MFFTNRPGDIIDITVYEFFRGKVKLLEKRRRKIYVEAVDVWMCYPDQEQILPGEKYWISFDEICREESLIQRKWRSLQEKTAKFKRKLRTKKKKEIDLWENELPF